ncbi:RTC4-like domain-containing protein [Mycena maculata]|uniref:Restriction of telomere capping protein 4 n=1 Tax=Mycena maculata TaxID=230809 RepID=A0AAD7JU64_9AGAR|nr:RTC4-like domain-containing protein [Mycena maculata]
MERSLYITRLDHRPRSQPTKGILNEDYGSSLDYTNLKRRKKKRTEKMVDLDSDSEDELNISSSSQPPLTHTQKPKEPLDTDVAIKVYGLKFKKDKKDKPVIADADGETTPTSKENPRARDNRNNAAASSSARPLREKVANRDQSPPGAREKRVATLLSQRTARDEKPGRSTARRDVPPPSATPRPPPRTTAGPSRSSTSEGKGRSQETRKPSKSSAFSDTKGKGREVDGSSLADSVESGSVNSRRQEKDHAKGKDREAQRFPPLSPLNDSTGSANGRRKDRAKGKGKEVAEFPAMSPLFDHAGGSRKEKEKGYPFPSPLCSPAKRTTNFLPSPLGTPIRNRDEGKLATSEFPAPSPLRPVANPKPKRAEARPFPMNTQSFEDTPGKRRSVGSESDDERDRKRYKNQPVVLAESYEYEEDSELLFISPGTDPKTLCPYCDTPLPAEPTPCLTRLLEQTFNKSYRDPRPSNPLGRKAPMGVFVAVCQRHRFESQTLPEAEERGWPKSIDWGGLKGRVQAMKRDISRILSDPGDPIVYGTDEKATKDRSEARRKKGPRMRCIFWKDLVKDLKTSGTKGVKGMKGQFANFEKTQPGYYGELGSMILHQTLYDMFPLDTIDADLVDPLTPNEFIQRILVPEVGMRLVMEDMSLDVDNREDRQRAVAVLRESAGYGVAMFPEDGGEWGGKKKHDADEVMGVADLMIMERARRRRKELEIEEREEDEMFRLQEEENEAEKKRKTAEKRRSRKGKEKDDGPMVVDQKTVPRPRPRPVPKNKGKPTHTAASTTSGMDTDSSSDPTPSRIDSDTEMTEQSIAERASGSAPKPRMLPPKRVETSDSEDFCEVLAVSPGKRRKPKHKSSATAASSDLERHKFDSDLGVKTSSRRRSPSVQLNSSKRATRGGSVVNLCSSSEDGGVSSDEPSEPRNSRRKPRKLLPVSSEEDPGEEDATTPRAKGSHIRAASASSNFFPLEVAARRRAAVAKG